MTKTDLRALRRRLGLTQLQLALALGVNPMTVARWEQGTRAITPLAATALTLYAERASRSTPKSRRRAS